MSELEARAQPYLFKLKLTKNVKRHIGRLFGQAGWVNAGQNWKGKDGQLVLMGWQQPRRVIVLRRALKEELVVVGENEKGQQLLAFIEADQPNLQGITGYEYAVLVTNTTHEVLSLGPLYRDRADCQGDPNFPHLWELKIPHLVHIPACSLRNRPALSFSFNRYELPRILRVTA